MEKAVRLSADCKGATDLESTLKLLKDKGITVDSYAIQDGRVSFDIRVGQKTYMEVLPGIVSGLSNPSVESAA